LPQFVFQRLQIFDQLAHLRRSGGGHHSQNTILTVFGVC
jgi:hypothetical protein